MRAQANRDKLHISFAIATDCIERTQMKVTLSVFDPAENLLATFPCEPLDSDCSGT